VNLNAVNFLANSNESFKEIVMPVNIEDRPREQVKEEVIDVLVHNYSHGIISNDAFERRLDKVIASTTAQGMMDQIADLEQTPDQSISRHREKQFSINYSDDPVKESDFMINIMGGSDRNGYWRVPKNLFAISIMGGGEIDFTDACFGSNTVTIYSFTLMGGNDIYVPENVNVVCKGFSLMGGVSNKAPSMAGRNAPTLVIKSINIMGGTDIKIKQTIKEKFVAFAHQMKATFSSK
jgi:hypothetical protein